MRFTSSTSASSRSQDTHRQHGVRDSNGHQLRRRRDPPSSQDAPHLPVFIEQLLEEIENEELEETLNLFRSSSSTAFRQATVVAQSAANNGGKTPRASDSAISKLPVARIYPWNRKNTENDPFWSEELCGICCDRLIDGVALSRMPCGHVYHMNCIVPWLTRLSNTCPECRFELETEDPLYEVGRKERMKDRKVFSCSCPKTTGLHDCFFPKVSEKESSRSTEVQIQMCCPTLNDCVEETTCSDESSSSGSCSDCLSACPDSGTAIHELTINEVMAYYEGRM